MSGVFVALLAVQCVAFIVFTIAAFRWLFTLRRVAVEQTGHTVPGFGATLAAFRSGFLDRRYARLRWTIAGSVLVLLAGGALFPLVMPA